jgi:pimeloyl-ACP methyl ester carboxylesterase
MLPHWTENSLDVNGIHVHYTRTGDGNKPALVLAHGFSDNGMCWLPVARDLEADYDVILPDARGHGKSARLHAGEDVDMPGDLAGLIRALGLRQPIVAGHSMGGSVTAVTAMLYPDLVRALVLEDPGWHNPPPKEEKPAQPQPNPFMDWLLSLEGKSLDELVAKCRADEPKWAEVELLPWAEAKQQLDKTIFQTNRKPAHDWHTVVPAIHCPTLLITAEVEKGAIITAEMAAEAQALNPRVQVVKIAGAGHSIRRDNYADYMSALRKFLKGV